MCCCRRWSAAKQPAARSAHELAPQGRHLCRGDRDDQPVSVAGRWPTWATYLMYQSVPDSCRYNGGLALFEDETNRRWGQIVGSWRRGSTDSQTSGKYFHVCNLRVALRMTYRIMCIHLRRQLASSYRRMAQHLIAIASICIIYIMFSVGTWSMQVLYVGCIANAPVSMLKWTLEIRTSSKLCPPESARQNTGACYDGRNRFCSYQWLNG
jgi:hypothetical protein